MLTLIRTRADEDLSPMLNLHEGGLSRSLLAGTFLAEFRKFGFFQIIELTFKRQNLPQKNCQTCSLGEAKKQRLSVLFGKFRLLMAT